MNSELHGRRLVFVIVGVALALFLVSLDQTIVGTAMPRIIAELQGLDYYAWVTTAYLVASTTMTPIAGKLGDLFGRKPFLLAGMVGFVFASMLCGQAQNMPELVGFRALQGLFGGTLFANVFAVLADVMAPAQRARIQGVFGGIFGISSVIGPAIGGFLTDNAGWRWVFYVNFPVGIVAVAVVFMTLPYIRSKASVRDIDFRGVALLVAGLVPMLVAFSITNQHEWTSPEVAGLLAFSAVMLVAFYFAERATDHPIVPFGLFANRTFSVSVVTSFLVTVGMFGSIVFVPLLYQGVLGVPATNSGLLLTPMMAGLILASIITGQLMTRIKRYRFLGTFGISVTVAGIWLLSGVNANTSQLEIVRDLLMIGFGLGATMPLYVNAVQSALPRQYLGVSSSQLQFWRNVGGSVGVSILGSILSHRLPQNIQREVTWLNLPPQASSAIPSGGSAQALFDPAQIAAIRSALPPEGQAVFAQIMDAVRTALAVTLHDLFLISAVVVSLAIVVSVLLDDVPIRGRGEIQRAVAKEGTPAFAE